MSAKKRPKTNSSRFGATEGLKAEIKKLHPKGGLVFYEDEMTAQAQPGHSQSGESLEGRQKVRLVGPLRAVSGSH